MWPTRLSIATAAAGIIAGAVVAIRARRFALGVPVTLDLWMAGGLLQLSAEKSWASIVIAGLVVVLRKLVTSGLRLVPSDAKVDA